MADHIHNDEINLRQLAKRILKILTSRKRIFTILLLGIMLVSTAYFVKTIYSPKYKSETILKSNTVRKDQINSILEKYNLAMKDEDLDSSIPSDLLNFLVKNNIYKFEAIEIKADITSPDKNDTRKFYKLITHYSRKPSIDNIEKSTMIIDKIRNEIALDNDVTISRIRLTKAILEIDTLIKVASAAGDNFKNNLGTQSGMVIMSDLYKSLNEILSRKSNLENELMYYNTENLIFKASPVVLSKEISTPIIIFFIGFLVWFFLCVFWVMGILIFIDED